MNEEIKMNILVLGKLVILLNVQLFYWLFIIYPTNVVLRF